LFETNTQRLGRLAVCVATLACAGTVAAPGIAQEQAETLDAGRGVVSGSTRRIGLGGAFVALADDSEGVAINPASVAVRLPYSFTPWDYGFGVDVAVGAWLPKNNFYNQPSSSAGTGTTALFGSIAGNVYYQHLGLGVSAEAQSNAGSRTDEAQGVTTDLAANFGTVHLDMAYGFLGGQLLLGAGPRFVGMSFDRHGTGSGLLSKAGVGYAAGVIVKPTVAQYRFAAAFKSPIDAELPAEAGIPPGTFHVPWEVALGFAYQFGRRPFNPPFVTAQRLARETAGERDPTPSELEQAEDELYERYLRLQRRYVLVSGELSLIEGGGQLGFSGQSSHSGPIVSPRLGLESEIIAHHLRLRAGSYYEPALVPGVGPRVHATGGLDVRLFSWSVFGLIDRFDFWQLSLAADGAREYLNTSFSIGFWH
jgi:hypothetical protein